MARFSVMAVMVTAGLGGARSAWAQVDRVPLTWNAPAGCPSDTAVLADVRRNAADAAEALAPFVAVVNVVGPTEGMWQASLRVEARGGRVERRFQAESCEAIASAAALIIALSAESGTEPAPPEPHRGPAEDKEAPRAPAAPAEHWQRSHLSLMTSGFVDGGTMPHNPAYGVEAAAGPTWTSPGWRVRVLGGASFFLPQRLEVSSINGTGDFWTLAFSGRGCFTAVITAVDLGVCVGGELVFMHATLITAPPDADHDTQYWLSPVGSVLASWTVSQGLAVFGRADVAVPGVRQSFHQINSFEDFYRVSAVAARGALGIELRFY